MQQFHQLTTAKYFACLTPILCLIITPCIAFIKNVCCTLVCFGININKNLLTTRVI